MKKAALLVFAALLVVMFSVPAMAMEHQFGGYWRTRAFTMQNFDGTDTEPPSGDWMGVDTRTRLFYTATFHENLKLVNGFEMNGTWGDNGRVAGRRADFDANRNGVFDDFDTPSHTSRYTDIGADGTRSLRIKHSYADFNLGPINAKIGVQPMALGRSFLFSDDFAGAIISYEGDGMSIPFFWVKAYEGGTSNNALDVDYYGINPNFSFGGVSINPFVLYVYSDNGRGWIPTANQAPAGTFTDEVGIFYAGMNVDLTFDPVSFWLTGIYQGGSIDFTNNTSADVDGWLGAIGANVGFGMGDVHGQFFYATGDDPNDPDDDAFTPPVGRSYYWSEILGLGVFDAGTPAVGDGISNVMAANLGVTVSPMDKLTVSLDGWWAQLDEVPVGADDDLGVEVDLRITYQLVEGLNLDLVGAYLFAGDAIYNGNDDADPYELGSQLSLSF